MPRPEQPLDPSSNPLHAFAQGLRELRRAAGNPTYRALAQKAGFSATALSTAASGKTVPSLDVTLAYVGACGGDKEEWQQRWDELPTYLESQARMNPAVTKAQPVGAQPETTSSPRDVTQMPESATVSAGPVVAVLERLAEAVADQWMAEDLAWLGDARPLPVRWAPTGRQVADHWEAILGSDHGGEPPELTGTLDEIVEFFRGLPSRRLVVLGEAGAGKTVLAVRLLLGLLRHRQAGEPVPVLMSVSNWDPIEHSLAGWLAHRLVTTYPALAARTQFGATIADQLLRAGLLIPILDGFDEMPAAFRPAALRRLNKGIPEGHQLVLTARGSEYQDAVYDRHGDVLTAAAVVELSPLRILDIQKYLRLSTAPYRASIWNPVFARLEDHPSGPLATTLSRPLMVWLMRVIYADGPANPDELLAERFGDQTSIEEHLLSQLVSTVYHPDWLDEGSFQHGRQPHQPAHRVEDAQRYLGFLARHVHAMGGSELAWWQLERIVPRSVMAVLTGIVFGVAIGVSIAVPQAIDHGIVSAGVPALSGTLTAGVAAGLTAAIVGSSREFVPTAVSFRRRKRNLRTFPRLLTQAAAVGLFAGAGTGLIVALSIVVTTGSDLTQALKGAGPMSIGIALAVMSARVLDTWLSAPVDVMRSSTPASVLRADRTSALAKGVVAGVVMGLAFGLTKGTIVGISAGLAAAVSRPLVGDLDQGFRKVGLTAWSRFIIARVWLALRRKLPWRTIAFLQDAHRRHILRQLGATYQFRHDRLQAALERLNRY